jgi:hypothetical protein
MSLAGWLPRLGKRGQSPIKEQVMNLALWIAAGVLAAVLLVAATNKLVIPQEKLATFPGGGWVEDFSPPGACSPGHAVISVDWEQRE